MTIDLNKKYQTRSGWPVRIYATDGRGKYPVHGAIWREDEFRWCMTMWTELGQVCGGDAGYDLVEVPPEPTYRPFLPEELPRIVGRRVRSKRLGYISVIVCHHDSRVTFVADRSGLLEYGIRALFENFEFLDYDAAGNEIVTPCGVRVES